jgi:hypothetical protein
MRLVGAIRRKGRILDEENEWPDLKFGAPRWLPPPVSIKDHVSWVRMNKHLNVLTHTGHMQSPNLVALCVDSWTIPYLASPVYNGIVFVPPMVCLSRRTRGRQH